MFTYEFTERADWDLQKLPLDLQVRIIKKIKFFCATPNPLAFAKRLVDFPNGEYRFQVAEVYRVIFDYLSTEHKILITRVGHRRNVYTS